ncbi:MAG TPA: cupin domain-containing protein [Polyangiaceae bacterium]
MIASMDGQFDCGVWECSPGRFRIRYRSDELVHILEGNVTVHVGSSTHSLSAGDVAYFPAGTDAEWHVIAHVKKLWVYRTPRPRRLARVARPVLRALSRAGF